jgi:hypothetical protein
MLGVARHAKAPYQMNHEEFNEFKVLLEKLHAKGYIKPSKSQYIWGTHVLFIYKKDGTLNMCVD